MKIFLSNSKLVFETTLPKTYIDFYNQGYIYRNENGLIAYLQKNSPEGGWLSLPINIDEKQQIFIEESRLTDSGFLISFYTEKPFDSFNEDPQTINQNLRDYGNPIVSVSIPGSGNTVDTPYLLADAKAAGAHYAILSAYVGDDTYVPKAYIQ